ncbi:TetR/AcrR family transcriptional regulator [Streptomyces sp. 8N706]|uniref:TetR/AcrR family transcriptional regulator n=1 Tax=Streptomyces sp. 8N706 TaxID=3457416 RepID=UPI003FD20B71
MGADRLGEVLDATYDCPTRYGVRRTTMDDIASAMGMSRSAVYQYVRSKDDAFRQLAHRLHAQALERARQAAAAWDVPYAEASGASWPPSSTWSSSSPGTPRTPPNFSTQRPRCSAGSAPPSPPACGAC